MTVYNFFKTYRETCLNSLSCDHCPLNDVCEPMDFSQPLNEKRLKTLISRVSKIIANEKKRTKE